MVKLLQHGHDNMMFVTALAVERHNRREETGDSHETNIDMNSHEGTADILKDRLLMCLRKKNTI